MRDLNEFRQIQMDAVDTWLRSLAHDRRKMGADPEAVSTKTQEAFWRFCNRLNDALCRMILEIDDNDDALLFAAIQVAQIAGVRGALINVCPGCAMTMLVEFQQAMTSGFHATMHALLEGKNIDHDDEVIHGPIQ